MTRLMSRISPFSFPLFLSFLSFCLPLTMGSKKSAIYAKLIEENKKKLENERRRIERERKEAEDQLKKRQELMYAVRERKEKREREERESEKEE